MPGSPLITRIGQHCLWQVRIRIHWMYISKIMLKFLKSLMMTSVTQLLGNRWVLSVLFDLHVMMFHSLIEQLNTGPRLHCSAQVMWVSELYNHVIQYCYESVRSMLISGWVLIFSETWSTSGMVFLEVSSSSFLDLMSTSLCRRREERSYRITTWTRSYLESVSSYF